MDYTTKGNVLTTVPFPLVVCFPDVYIQILTEGELKAVSCFLSNTLAFWSERSPFGCSHVACKARWHTIVIVVVADVLTTLVPSVFALTVP